MKKRPSTEYFRLVLYFCPTFKKKNYGKNQQNTQQQLPIHLEVALIKTKQYCRFPLHCEPRKMPHGIRERFVYVLIDTFGASQTTLARFFGKHRSTICRDYDDARWKIEHLKGYDRCIYNTREMLLYNNSVWLKNK